MSSLYNQKQNGRTSLGWLARLVILTATVSVCLFASVFLYSRWQEARLGTVSRIGEKDAALNPLEQLYLESYLALNAEALEASSGDGSLEASFVISPGETAEDVANNLLAQGFIEDSDLYVNYVRYVGLDRQMEVGRYRLNSAMTIPDLARSLSQAGVQEVELIFLDGWRIAEMVAYLEATQPANIDPQEFARIASGLSPFDKSGYDFLADHDRRTSLEGYLFPEPYRIPVDADAYYLVDIMLKRFDEKVPDSLRTAFRDKGLTVHEAVTLASIIQKETTVDSEMPLMAGVYGNRLAQGMLLQADPTVQFALGFDRESGSWWKSPLDEQDLAIDSPYNTYLYDGLPPGPLNNPALPALQAVAEPAQTDYLYFVADCVDGSAGSHVFSRTYEEHLENVYRCRS